MVKKNIFAPAKINLGLRITGKRPDGYHTLESLFIPINLRDLIEITYPHEKDEILFVGKYGRDISEKSNTLIKALHLIKKKYKNIPPLKIKVTKNIPHGSGLGGGSSDAANFIDFLNKEFSLKIPFNELIKLGMQIGADVPFFFYHSPAYVQGIGEVITPIKFPFSFYVYLFYPNISISTAIVYKKFDLNLTQYQKNIILDPLLRLPSSVKEFGGSYHNDLEGVVLDLEPRMRELRRRIEDIGFDFIQMTGSGSTFYGLSEKKVEIEKSFFQGVEVFECEVLL